MALIKANDFHFAYLTSFIFSRTISMLNFYPLGWKQKIMSMKAGNLRANQILYKSLVDKSDNAEYIGMVEDGDVGAFNRANRSLHHFVENGSAIVACVALSSFVFPKQTCVLASIYCLGRIIHQRGYSTGYGSHGAGFGLAMISGIVIDGLNLLVAAKGFGYL